MWFDLMFDGVEVFGYGVCFVFGDGYVCGIYLWLYLVDFV